MCVIVTERSPREGIGQNVISLVSLERYCALELDYRIKQTSWSIGIHGFYHGILNFFLSLQLSLSLKFATSPLFVGQKNLFRLFSLGYHRSFFIIFCETFEHSVLGGFQNLILDIV
jgi:hypothetical protein